MRHVIHKATGNKIQDTGLVFFSVYYIGSSIGVAISNFVIYIKITKFEMATPMGKPL